MDAPGYYMGEVVRELMCAVVVFGVGGFGVASPDPEYVAVISEVYQGSDHGPFAEFCGSGNAHDGGFCYAVSLGGGTLDVGVLLGDAISGVVV